MILSLSVYEPLYLSLLLTHFRIHLKSEEILKGTGNCLKKILKSIEPLFTHFTLCLPIIIKQFSRALSKHFHH